MPALATVNNFARPGGMSAPFVSPVSFSGRSYELGSRTGGSGLLAACRSNDFHVYRPTHRVRLALLTTPQEDVRHLVRTLYIAVARGKPCGAN